MTIRGLASFAADKNNFTNLQNYYDFCRRYLESLPSCTQATIVATSEHNFVFYQYDESANYAITRPINRDIFLDLDSIDRVICTVTNILDRLRSSGTGSAADDVSIRRAINTLVYSCQQSIGAALDALPDNSHNTAKKINGDLFEQFIRLLLSAAGLTVQAEVIDVQCTIGVNQNPALKFQHDIVLRRGEDIKAIGSVKTSSKDRLSKIFLDKILYNKLTDGNTPHFAVFLHDVQRAGRHPRYKITTTFLPGHFKAYSVHLTSLDGVYYCDPRPIMRTDTFLQQSIKTLDSLILDDIWNFL